MNEWKHATGSQWAGGLIILILLTTLSSRANAQQLFARLFTGIPVTDSGISAGLCWGDYNNDGLDDLFVANWYNQNNYLYRNAGNGQWEKITTGEIVNDGGFSSGACWGDYDNDGYIDLFVANQQNQNNFLYHNNGDGTFISIASGDIVSDYGDSYSAAWADYDLDGYLDLFVANSGGQNNFLYHNSGDGTFERVISRAIVSDGGFSFAATWGDFNNDRFPDLFVANTNGENNFLYRNKGDGTFIKVTEGDIVSDGGFSNGGSWGDYDNDGDLDLFVANGTFFPRGEANFLYRNEGDGRFISITEGEIVNDDAKSMSGTWADFNNDGHLDLFVSTYMHNDHLYLNNGDGTFYQDTQGMITNIPGFCTGNAAADYDNDGDADLFMVNWENQNNVFYLNNTVDRNWLKIICNGTTSNKQAIGTKIMLKTTINGMPLTQMREITSNHGFRSQGSSQILFGLAKAETVESIVIDWPSGKSETLRNIKANRTITVTESKGITKDTPLNLTATAFPVREILYQKINDESVEAAIALYYKLKESESNRYGFDQGQLNYLGYVLLGQGRIEESIKILELNASVFPQSANVYDSLCDAYLAKGDRVKVIDCANKVLETLPYDPNPDDNFKEVLANNARYRLKHLVQ